jgi:hypothetical protein
LSGATSRGIGAIILGAGSPLAATIGGGTVEPADIAGAEGGGIKLSLRGSFKTGRFSMIVPFVEGSSKQGRGVAAGRRGRQAAWFARRDSYWAKGAPIRQCAIARRDKNGWACVATAGRS